MELKLVNAKEMNSLEQYLFAIVTGMLSIKTIAEFHIQAIKLGILKEDQECRVNTIIWDCKRILKILQDQAESIKELLPDEFSIENVIKELAKQSPKNKKKQ